jgi:hypothetical protein
MLNNLELIVITFNLNRYQVQLAPPQQNYYQYQTPPTSQQILPPAQPRQIEEAPLIEL